MDTLESLLGKPSDSSSGFLDPAQLLAPLMPFIILTSIVMVLFGVLYVVNMLMTYRSHKATIETRDILRQMNERDKARSSTPQTVSDYAADGVETASSSSIEKS